MPPVMHAIYSSHVKRVGHDPSTQELHVEWDTGKKSVYSGVPADVAERVRTSWSVGTAIRNEVRPHYDHRYVP